MLEASSRRQVPPLLAAALAMALACGEEPSAGTVVPGASGSSGMSTAGSGIGGAVATGGAGNSSGGTITPVGGMPAGSSGSAGAVSGGNGGSLAGSGSNTPGGSGGTSASGSGGAAGSSGAASGAGGGSGSPSYSTDPATFGGQPRCQGLDVCESFETTELGALPSGFKLEGYGTRTVGASADRAMRGARSLKIEVAAQSAVTAWLTRSSLGALGAQHFGRAFYRIEKPAPAEFVHFDLLQASGPYQGHTNAVRYASTGTGVGSNQSNWSFIYNVQPSGDGAGSEFGSEGDRSAHARVDDWMCLEWSFDAAKQDAQYYLDGAAIDYLHIDTERAEIPVFDSLAVGFGKYQNTGAFLVYVDEVAFNGERIGCNN
jgi:hypothetical protein